MCGNCKERGHCSEKCPELWAPLKEGFYKGGGGGGGGGGGDDDERLEVYPALSKDNGRAVDVHLGIRPGAHRSGLCGHVLQGEQVPCVSHKVGCGR